MRQGALADGTVVPQPGAVTQRGCTDRPTVRTGRTYYIFGCMTFTARRPDRPRRLLHAVTNELTILLIVNTLEIYLLFKYAFIFTTVMGM